MKVKINLADFTETNPLFRGLKKDEDNLIKLVDNPQMINTYPQQSSSSNSINLASDSGTFLQQSDGEVMGDSGPYDYVIITNRFLNYSPEYIYEYNFQDLVDYKNQNGIQTKLVTVEDIYENYGGNDNQEKIRNFIIDAYQNWGIEYVLLGGDGDGANVGGESGDNIIPSRGFYCFPRPPYEDYNIASDLYYAALDGTWNNDSDDRWGEPGEEDFLAEVYVGRAPVDSWEALDNFIKKTLAHEFAMVSNDSYLYNALMVGEWLQGDGHNWGDWGGDFMDEVIPLFPKNYDIETLYDRDRSWNMLDLFSKINDGQHIVNHDGHANNYIVMKTWWYYFYDYNPWLKNQKYFFGYSCGCYAGAFDNRFLDGSYIDTDAIIEHWLTYKLGAFAFIGNSRYGWIGVGETFNWEFFDAIFKEGIKEIGRANQDSKEDCIGYIISHMWSDYYRWCYYTINLLGDPTAYLYEKPVKVTIDPDYISIEPGHPANYTINVQNLKNESATYKIEILNINPDWVTLSTDTITLNGETGSDIDLQILPPRHWSSTAKKYQFEILVTDISDPYSEDSVEASLNVLLFRDVSIIVEPLSMQVVPGKYRGASIKIQNMGNGRDIFRITVPNLQSDWYELSSGMTIFLNPGQETLESIRISPPRKYTTAPGLYYPNVTATSYYDSAIFDFCSIELEVLEFHEIGLSISPKSAEIIPGSSFTFEVNITNFGNVFDNFSISLNYTDFTDNNETYRAYPTKIQDEWVYLESDQVHLDPGQSKLIGITYSIPDDWKGMQNAIYKFTVNVSSQINTSLFALELANFTIVVIPRSLLNYIYYELNELQKIVSENLENPYRCKINRQLNIAKEKIKFALEELFKGAITKTVLLEKLSKINLAICDVIVLIGDPISKINKTIAYQLIKDLHQIRDDITYSMGFIISTDLSMKIADIEIGIINFADEIYNSTCFIKAIAIDINLWQACENLDWALIFLSSNSTKMVRDKISKAINNLEQTKYTVFFLQSLGLISNEDTLTIRNKVNQFIEELDALISPDLSKDLIWSTDIRFTEALEQLLPPDIAVDSENKVHIVWTDYRTGHPEVYYNCFNGSSWIDDYQLSTSSLGAGYPSLAIGPDNTVHVAWVEVNIIGGGYEILIHYNSFNGDTWSGEQQ
ncbi:MAG: C25 family cysteine peptidase, partial [Promethearchaeota archaeon]